jgi:hypothetical protein
MKNSIKDHWREGLQRCRENLKNTTDPVRRQIIQEQIMRYSECIKKDIPDIDNSFAVNLQDEDKVKFSTGQGF